MDNVIQLQCGACKKIYNTVVDRSASYIMPQDLPKCKGCSGIYYARDPENIKPQIPIYVPPVVLKVDF
jgi:NAD-dependent SIR2 family protein deacetylase